MEKHTDSWIGNIEHANFLQKITLTIPIKSLIKSKISADRQAGSYIYLERGREQNSQHNFEKEGSSGRNQSTQF